MNILTLSSEQKQKIEAVNYDFESQEKESVKFCDLCGGERFTVIGSHDRYYHKTYGLLCECGNCFISPRLTIESSKLFYSGIYRRLVSAYHGRTIDEISVQEDQKIYLKGLIDLFNMSNIDKTQIHSILDIGGSTGVMLLGLQDWLGHKCELLNIDPSKKETSESIQKEVETKIEFFENINFNDKKFDLIINCWAIDHLRSIKLSLEKVRSLMHDESLFWFDFMDFRKIYLKKQSVEGALKIDHNFYLTDVVMESYLDICGFKILRKFVANDKWHIGYLCKKGDYVPINNERLQKAKDQMYSEIRKLDEKIEDKRYL